ncbi:MAG: HD domain-containing protein [Burkholderiales bacterium]|nr:HD domain-containing protein [Burkholderiales bacterium]
MGALPLQEQTGLANPHMVSAIMQASGSRTFIATQDILDERGNKLWARDQPVTYSLHQRLLERKLKAPIESCLRAEDGVTVVHLRDGLQAFVESDHALAPAVRRHAELLLREVSYLPLHSAMQLLLTTVQTTRPAVFDHAVASLAVAGAMAVEGGQERFDLRLAMLGGLLHDLGEMYLDPQYLDMSRPLDLQGWRHVVSHPLIGQMLITQLTDYPPALAAAVAQHHERLDGSGYPARSAGAAVSDLGRLLGLVEAALGITAARSAPLSRAALALRLVPGEFDNRGIGFITSAARAANENLSAALQGQAGEGLPERLAVLCGQIDAAMLMAEHMATGQAPAAIRQVCNRLQHRLQRLQVGTRAMGLWSPLAGSMQPLDWFELQAARRELEFRLGSIRQECLWSHTGLSAEEEKALEPLWAALG